MRMYADPVEVRPATGDETGAPAAFLWRGRLYVVRSVLGHWRERRAWWASPAARLVHGEGEAPAAAAAAAAAGSAAVASAPVASVASVASVADLAEEREVWRVAASPGRVHAGGVYDLSREHVASSASRGSPPQEWHLVRVED